MAQANAARIVFLLLVMDLHVAALASSRIVDVAGLGRLRGNVLLDNAWGVPANVSEFLGVPFAKPPTGKRRFLPPFAQRGWRGIRDATSPGPYCVQPPDPYAIPPPDPSQQLGSGTSEDCLLLNIWAPHSATKASPKPVYVWIHGGGYVYGAGTTFDTTYNVSNGTYGIPLATPIDADGNKKTDGMVVVTINYRMGALGFFSHEEVRDTSRKAGGPATLGGMNAMLDVVMALQWVHDHIGAFGGDPTQVTIGGVSAGAVSCCMLAHSTLAQGLFKGIILESGECTGPWGPDVGAVGLESSLQYMRSVNATSLAELQGLSPLQLISSPSWGIPAAVDGHFLRKLPNDLPVWLRGGSAILGAADMDNLCSPPYGNQTYPVTWPTNKTDFDVIMEYWFGSDASEVQANYQPLPGAPVTPQATPFGQAFLNATRDTGVTCPALWFATKLHSAGNRIFLYEFEYNNGNASVLLPDGSDGTAPWPFAGHGSESGYVFSDHYPIDPTTNKTWVDPVTGVPYPSPDQMHLGDVVSAYWASFVVNGTPLPVGSASVAWPEFHPTTGAYLHLNLMQTPDVRYHERTCKFWNSYRHRGHLQYERFEAFAQCDGVTKPPAHSSEASLAWV